MATRETGRKGVWRSAETTSRTIDPLRQSIGHNVHRRPDGRLVTLIFVNAKPALELEAQRVGKHRNETRVAVGNGALRDTDAEASLQRGHLPCVVVTAKIERRAVEIQPPCGHGPRRMIVPVEADQMKILKGSFARRQAELLGYEMLHFAGHDDSPGQSLAEAAQAVIGRDEVNLKPFIWPLVYLAAPFSPMMREVIEMLWLWRYPLRLDNTKLVGLIGPEPHTPLYQAVAAALGPRPTRGD